MGLCPVSNGRSRQPNFVHCALNAMSARRRFFMFIGPWNDMAFAQGCKEAHINQQFGYPAAWEPMPVSFSSMFSSAKVKHLSRGTHPPDDTI